MRAPAQRVTDTIAHIGKKGGMMNMLANDLADIGHRLGLTGAREMVDLQGQKGAYKIDLDKRLGKLGAKAAKLSDAERATVGEFLTDSTVEQKWGYQPSWKDGNQPLDPVYKSKFDALPQRVKDVIIDANQLGHEQYEQLRQAREELNKTLGGEGLPMPAELDGPYAPLRRHGDYLAYGKSREYLDAEKNGDLDRLSELQTQPEHYFVQHTSTMGEAKELARSFEGKYAKADAREKEPYYKSIGGATWETMQKLRERVKASVDDGTPHGKAKADALSRSITDMYIQSLGDRSIRQAGLQRKNIPGIVKKQMLMSIMSNGYQHNNFVANMAHNSAIEAAMSKMREQVEQGGTMVERSQRQDIVNEFQKRQILAQSNTAKPWEDNIMRFTGMWKLLSSPAHYLQYLSQPYTMSLPLMAGKHGAGRAWRGLVDGMMDTGRMLSKTDGMLPELNYSTHKSKVGDEVGMLKALKNSGILDIGHEQDYGNPRLFSDNAASRAWTQATSKVTAIAQGMEQYNRVASALTAYRLSYADHIAGNDHEAAHNTAVKAAMDNVRQGYGDYSAFNAPRIMMNGSVGPLPMRLLTQFKKFQIIHASLLGRLVYGSFKGASADERAIARKQLGFMAAHYGVLAGATGIPGAQAVLWALHQVFGADDEPEDTETWLRRQIDDPDMAELLLHGVPALAGADISSRVGAGDILNPMGRASVNGSPLDSKSAAEDTTLALMGPAVGMALNMVDGASQMRAGNYYKGLEQLMPSGVRDGLRAYRYANEGVSTRRGDTVIAPEDISFADAALQAVGIPPLDVANRSREAEVLYQYDQHFKNLQSELSNRYVQAAREGDSDKLDEIRQKWSEMQDAQRRNGFTVSPVSTLLKARTAASKREASVVGGLETSKKDKGFAEQLQEY
jgi:hypothetical protein